MVTHSPWLTFDRTHYPSHSGNLDCDVAIVGAGISGVSTLYSLLTTTQKRVVLLEKSHVASGATGTNAGLAVAFIEKPMSELVAKLGKEKADKIFADLEEGWQELHSIHKAIGFEENLVAFQDAANGFIELDFFITFLKEHLLQGIENECRYLVVESLKGQIPEEFTPYITFVPHSTILSILKTIDTSYIACCERPQNFMAKRMNSARFCYKILEFLKKNFPERFQVYEETNITKVRLSKDQAVLEHAQGTISAKSVILCTNAFKDFVIWDEERKALHTTLQDKITRRIGFLASFPTTREERYVRGFFCDEASYPSVPIWYYSSIPNHEANSLLGGPEFDEEPNGSADWVQEKQLLSLELTKRFVRETFKEAPVDFSYFWHGWMAYTEDGLRLVGPDKEQPRLIYNLACNGIGIVPACNAAKKIARDYV